MVFFLQIHDAEVEGELRRIQGAVRLTTTFQQFYKATKGEGLEVLWISGDKTEKDQLDYYHNKMPPWKYIPFGEPAIQ